MKRRISDLLDGIPAPDVELNHRPPLSSSRIKELTMSKVRNKKPGRLAFRVLVAAAVIAMMALTVFAVGSGAEWFKMFFTEENGEVLSDEQIALIEKNAADIPYVCMPACADP